MLVSVLDNIASFRAARIGKIAVDVINDYGDDVLEVCDVRSMS